MVVLAGALGVGGCHDDGECEEKLRVCSIDEADCRAHVFVQTACARGFDGREVPEVHSITRSEFADSLRGDPPTAEQQREDAQTATALRMLALLPPGQTSSDDESVSAYAQNVLAFYSREDRSVTIVETNLADADRDTEVFVLSHEFVHAQTDVDIGLQELFDANVDSTDSEMAMRALVEGEAVHYSNVTMARMPGRTVSESGFESYYREWQADRRAAAADPAIGFTELRASFPYPFGGAFVTSRWFEGGAEGVLALYDDPAHAASAYMSRFGAEGPADVPPLSADPLPEGWSVVVDDTFGAWFLFAFASRATSPGTVADTLASEWRGDRILVVGGPNDGEVALAWKVRFAAVSAASSFSAVLGNAPPEGVRAVEVAGNDVTMIMAPDDATLATWQGTFATAHVEGSGQRLAGPVAPQRTRLLTSQPKAAAVKNMMRL